MRKGKPNDPERRTRILRAALEVIAQDGVHAASYRRIAAQAGVPLGSTTYYFADLETLIVSAIETLRDGLEPRCAAPLRGARTDAGAQPAGCGPPPRLPRGVSLVILRRSLSDGAARAVDALMWGWWSYRALHTDNPLVEDMVRDVYRALVDFSTSGNAALEELSRT